VDHKLEVKEDASRLFDLSNIVESDTKVRSCCLTSVFTLHVKHELKFENGILHVIDAQTNKGTHLLRDTK
jgi:hypothetical protein